MRMRTRILFAALALVLIAALLGGCGGEPAGGGGTEPAGGEGGAGADFPAKDPAQPFAVGEKGTVTLVNDQAYDIQVQRETGTPLFVLSMKKSAVIDPSVSFAVRTFEAGVPEELADEYAAVGSYALEMHVVGETGYGFALRPKLQIYFADPEIEAAQAGGAVGGGEGSLVVLYKEQRSPKWVAQTSVGVDKVAKVVTVSNIAGAGAWRLAAKKAP
jgi:hypothetical protein